MNASLPGAPAGGPGRFVPYLLLAGLYLGCGAEFLQLQRGGELPLLPLLEETAGHIAELQDRPLPPGDMEQKARAALELAGFPAPEKTYAAVRHEVDEKLLRCYRDLGFNGAKLAQLAPYASPFSWRVSFFEGARSSMRRGRRWGAIFFPDGSLKEVYTVKYAPTDVDFARAGGGAETQKRLELLFPAWAGRRASASPLDYPHHGLGSTAAIWRVQGTEFAGGHLAAFERHEENHIALGLEFYHPAAQTPLRSALEGWPLYLAGVCAVFLAGVGGIAGGPSLRVVLTLDGGLICALCAGLLYEVRTQPVFAFGSLIALAAALFFTYEILRRPLVPPSGPAAVALSLGGVLLACAASFYLCSDGLAGCNALCTVLRYSVAPLVIALLWRGRREPSALRLAALAAPVLLTPHCICDNFANHCSLLRWGASPYCLSLVFGAVWAGLLVQSGVLRPRLLIGLIAAGSLAVAALGVGHVVFHYPW